MVMCGALQWHGLSHLSPDPLWTHPGFLGPHKEPATKGRALLPSLLLHLLFASYGSSTKANPTAWWKSDPAALRSMLYLFPIAPHTETPTPDISADGNEVGCSCCCPVCMNRYKEWQTQMRVLLLVYIQ